MNHPFIALIFLIHMPFNYKNFTSLHRHLFSVDVFTSLITSDFLLINRLINRLPANLISLLSTKQSEVAESGITRLCVYWLEGRINPSLTWYHRCSKPQPSYPINFHWTKASPALHYFLFEKPFTRLYLTIETRLLTLVSFWLKHGLLKTSLEWKVTYHTKTEKCCRTVHVWCIMTGLT